MSGWEFIGLIIAMAAIAYAVISTTKGMFLWSRAEASADRRAFEERLEASRKEANDILKAIQDEMRDFHERLCKIEEDKIKIITGKR